MKTEEQKSAFILRVEEMVKEIETLIPEGGGGAMKGLASSS